MRVPPPLRPGDLVAVVAPSSPFPREDLLAGLAWLHGRYALRVARDLFDRRGYLAGGDARRARELGAALADPDVRAVFCARGGYGLTRIVDALPWGEFCAAPKWLVGFSDATALHVEALRCGVSSAHGPNVTGLSRASALERARLLGLLERAAPFGWTGLEIAHPGAPARGPAAGGNLTLLAFMAAAGRLTLPEGCVLFLEDVTERPYRIDRMLTALRSGGHLGRARAIVLGAFTECTPGPDGVTVEEVVAERTAGLGVTVLAGAPFGHGHSNCPIPMGFLSEVDGPTVSFRAPD